MSRQRKITLGVGVIVLHPTEPKVLVTRRKKGIGKGAISFPGGHVEEMELAMDAAERETREETGLIVQCRWFNYTHILHTEERFYTKEKKHEVTMYFVADVTGGVLSNPEPSKHEDWQWKTLDELMIECTGQDWIPLSALIVQRSKIGL